MNLLAVETSSNACSVALRCEHDVIERHETEPRAHTRTLIPFVKDVMQEADLPLSALDALVLGNGPGSFIGMRIGASVVQGLAHGAGLRIVPVSSLAAVAAECMRASAATDVAVAQDARMSEVYLGLFHRADSGLPREISPEVIVKARAMDLPPARGGEWLLAGEGWQRYPEMKVRHHAGRDQAPAPTTPRARYLLELGIRGLQSGAAISPELLQPAYLRQQVATPPPVG